MSNTALIRFLFNQVIWFGFVSLGNYPISVQLIGFTFAALLYIADSLVFKSIYISKKSALFLGIYCLIVGIIYDSALRFAGLIDFNHSWIISPPFMWCVWILLAAYFKLSMEFFRKHLIIAGICAAIVGPFSYRAGQAMGSLTLFNLNSYFAIGLFWMVFFPATLWIFVKRNEH